jgi:uncharacterized protein (DUF1778 family)
MGTKTERLNLRLTMAQDTTLRRAAEAKGVPVSDYVLGHAVQAAEAELADRRVFVVDEAAWSLLQEALEQPPRPALALRSLLSEPTVLDRQ